MLWQHPVHPALAGLVERVVGYDDRPGPASVHHGIPGPATTVILSFDEPLDVGWASGSERARRWRLASGRHAGTAGRPDGGTDPRVRGAPRPPRRPARPAGRAGLARAVRPAGRPPAELGGPHQHRGPGRPRPRLGPARPAGGPRGRHRQFAAALRLARSRTPWAQVATRTGFADQPHLVREFGALAGQTPTQWAAEVFPNLQDAGAPTG